MIKLLLFPIKIFVKLVLLATMFVVIYLLLSDGKGVEYIEKEIHIGEETLTVMVSDTDEKRIRGLSGRESLDLGMLFVFNDSDYHGIWMKDMNLPIDIIWLNDSFEVVHIEERVSPDTFPEVFKPKSPALYVLEVNEGFVEAKGIKVGDVWGFN